MKAGYKQFIFLFIVLCFFHTNELCGSGDSFKQRLSIFDCMREVVCKKPEYYSASTCFLLRGSCITGVCCSACVLLSTGVVFVMSKVIIAAGSQSYNLRGS